MDPLLLAALIAKYSTTLVNLASIFNKQHLNKPLSIEELNTLEENRQAANDAYEEQLRRLS